MVVVVVVEFPLFVFPRYGPPLILRVLTPFYLYADGIRGGGNRARLWFTCEVLPKRIYTALAYDWKTPGTEATA